MRAVRLLMCLVSLASCVFAQNSIAQFTKDMRKIDGFVPLYWDEREGKLWMEISRWNQEFLFLDSLPAGIGSNDIGLDRGQVGRSRVVKFERVGPKVLLEEVNYGFRASGSDRGRSASRRAGSARRAGGRAEQPNRLTLAA